MKKTHPSLAQSLRFYRAIAPQRGGEYRSAAIGRFPLHHGRGQGEGLFEFLNLNSFFAGNIWLQEKKNVPLHPHLAK